LLLPAAGLVAPVATMAGILPSPQKPPPSRKPVNALFVAPHWVGPQS